MAQDIVRLPIKKADHAADINMPRYMTGGAAGMDLYAAVKELTTVLPGEVSLIPTGLLVAVPDGYELQIRPRSGLAAKKGIGILNSPGTIDADYRGEIQVILINLGPRPFTIKRHDRIAQMVLCPVSRAVPFEIDQLPVTERNDGGFGHTGNK